MTPDISNTVPKSIAENGISVAMERAANLVVSSSKVKYTNEYIYADYDYEEALVTKSDTEILVSTFAPSLQKFRILPRRAGR